MFLLSRVVEDCHQVLSLVHQPIQNIRVHDSDRFRLNL